MLRFHEFSFRTNVLGMARSILAVSLLLTLCTNSLSDLFYPTGVTNRELLRDSIAQSMSLFSLFGRDALELARSIAVAILALVCIGWRPRWTGILHWWVSFSFSISAVLVDGGDQINSILSMLLIPFCLADGRVSHWESESKESAAKNGFMLSTLLASVYVIIRLQVAAIYFQASTAKFAVDAWSNGTAVYYWFYDSIFGMPAWLEPLLRPILLNSHGVVIVTWSVLIFEAVLACAFFMPQRFWKMLLPLAIAFHFGIALIHNLSSFFLTMTAALIIFLRPLNEPLRWPKILGLRSHRAWFKAVRLMQADNSIVAVEVTARLPLPDDQS